MCSARPLTAEGLPATWFRHEHKPWVFFPVANRSSLAEAVAVLILAYLVYLFDEWETDANGRGSLLPEVLGVYLSKPIKIVFSF